MRLSTYSSAVPVPVAINNNCYSYLCCSEVLLASCAVAIKTPVDFLKKRYI